MHMTKTNLTADVDEHFGVHYLTEFLNIVSHAPYIVCMAIICLGLYTITSNSNYFKKLMGLTVLQSGTILFFIAFAKVHNGQIPILNCLEPNCDSTLFVNPLPHVLMLTAIVVGIATLALGLALIIRTNEEYRTIEEIELEEIDSR